MPAVELDDLTRYRGEILAHCYRMSGSIHDAEDLTQETLLRAWRALDSFEGRSSIKTWLYRIATRVCLTALEKRARRPLPSGLNPPSTTPEAELEPGEDLPWLTPFVTSTAASEPEAIADQNADIRLAFVVALQHLAPRQRAALLLCDVLGLKPAEVGQVLDMSTAAVYSALARARRTLDGAGVRDREEHPTYADEPRIRAVVDEYVAAFADADLHRLAELLRQDVRLEMPPRLEWFSGRDAVLAFLDRRILTSANRWHLEPAVANGQPAALCYVRTSDGSYRPHAVHVLDVRDGRITRIVAFNDERLVAARRSEAS